jgi:ABC-type proline/glycine betaine transport system substrate-binding protein
MCSNWRRTWKAPSSPWQCPTTCGTPGEGLRRPAKACRQFDKKLYGIGSGAPANLSLKEIIDKNEFDLGQWKLVESSEQAMLAQVDRAVKKQQFITFLGWTPHPMNVKLKMHYLTGGENGSAARAMLHPDPQGLSTSLPECGEAAGQPEVHAGHGEQHHGRGCG